MTDWQPGDLALCVKGGKITSLECEPPLDGFPAAGSIYTVKRAGTYTFGTGTKLALWFTNAPRNSSGDRVWSAERFVKVTPGADIEGVEVERKAPKPAKKSEGVVI